MSNNMDTPAFVFNCDYNGLGLIQALGRRGVPVCALDSKQSIGTYSRYACYIQVPDPLCDELGFINALLAKAEKLDGKPLLLPTNDHWAEAISKHKDQLSRYYALSVSDYDTVSLVLDKERFGRWASAKGFSVPWVMAREEALEQRKLLEYPVAIKANARRRPGQDIRGQQNARAADKLRFKLCNSVDVLKKTFALADHSNVPVFCQQLIHGRSEQMRTIGVYARKGIVYGIMYGRKVRGYPPTFGDCIVGQAETVPEWAHNLAVNLCHELRYTGIAEIEVMQDVVSGEYFLIEINPRSWSWVGVCPSAGVDLAWLAYSDLVLGEKPRNCLKSCTDGKPVIYAKVLADLQNTLIWYRLTDAKDWVLSPLQWWNTYKGQKRVFAEFSMDDPFVALMATFQSGKQVLSKVIHAVRVRRSLDRQDN